MSILSEKKGKLIVTPEQYHHGYIDKTGLMATFHPYKLIKKLDDGNFLVETPAMRAIYDDFYFTFGSGQPNHDRFVCIRAETYDQAREKMVARFGNKWAFQYAQMDWYNEDGISQEKEYNLKELK